MKLILIRHGVTEANEKRLYCGSTDLSLSQKGREELIKIKKEAALPDIRGMRVITSGMRRCEETLFLLYGETDHETDRAFCEMDFGKFEMRSYEEMKNDKEYIKWITGDNESNVTSGGESGNIVKERAIRALDLLISEGRDALLITHGGVISAIMSHLFPDENKNRYEWQPAPGRGYIIDTGKRNYIWF